LVGEMTGISSYQSYELYQQLEKQLSEAGLQPAYVVEQEMDLRMRGVKPAAATDTSQLAVLQQLGYAHFLKISAVDLTDRAGLYPVSAAEEKELQAGYGKREDSDSKATMRFDLYATDSRRLVYRLSASTNMGGLPLPGRTTEEGQGSVTVSAATSERVLAKALQKGTKKLLQACRCCQ